MMKKMLLCVFALCTVSLCPQAAADLFAAGKYGEALTEYEKNQVPDATTLLHMSQCASRAGNHTKAVLYAARLLRHTSWQQYRMLSKQIMVAQHQAGARSSAPNVWWQVRTLLSCVPLLVWQLLFILLWLVLLWFGRYWVRRRRIAKLAAFAMTIALVGCVTWWAYRQRIASYVVVHERSPLRSGPGERYAQLHEVVPATLLPVVGRAQGSGLFFKVDGAAGRGWIAQSAVHRV